MVLAGGGRAIEHHRNQALAIGGLELLDELRQPFVHIGSHQSPEAPPPPESPPPKPPKPSPGIETAKTAAAAAAPGGAGHQVAHQKARQETAAAPAAVAARSAGAQSATAERRFHPTTKGQGMELNGVRAMVLGRVAVRETFLAWATISPDGLRGGHHGLAVAALAQRGRHFAQNVAGPGHPGGRLPGRSPLPGGCGVHRWPAAASCPRWCSSGPRPRRGKWCWRRLRWARLRAWSP